MPHDHTQDQAGPYPAHVACLLCPDPHPVFFTLYHLAKHYREVHPLVVGAPERKAA
jgi:hypothetical protein